MARGKYKARKNHRDTQRLEFDIARLETQLAHEVERLADVQQRARADSELRSELTAAVAERDAACNPQFERLSRDRETIRSCTRQLHEANKPVARAWSRLADWGWNQLGPESFLYLLTGNHPIIVDGVTQARGIDADAAEAIQRARGIRLGAAARLSTQQRHILVEAAADGAGISLPEDDPILDTEAGWKRFHTLVAADPASRLAFSSPVPWLDTTFHNTSGNAALGVCTQTPVSAPDPPATIASAVTLSVGTAAQREATAGAGATTVVRAFAPHVYESIEATRDSQIATPISYHPQHPNPSDAEALRAWYSAAALGEWGRHRTHIAGRIGVAAAASVPFWLPPGHTKAYLDSEPLAEDDLADMRLPFAQVLLTFAEPVRLPPSKTSPPSAASDALRWIDHCLDGHRDATTTPSVRDMLTAATQGLTQTRPTLWEALAHRGGHIEGVLLLADAHGHLDDLFAWCIRVPSTSGKGNLGRWTIAASRAMTHYSDFVTNAAAVVAWADWHLPGHTRLDDAATHQGAMSKSAQRQRAHGDNTVHVLDATTTLVDTSSASSGTLTRPMAPHRRRGHWRRQRYGPGRRETKRIRIAPILVNANKLGAERAQVIYRLPAPS